MRRGRPVVSEADRLHIFNIRLNTAQIAKLAKLGGPAWIRDRIDKARGAPSAQEEAFLSGITTSGQFSLKNALSPYAASGAGVSPSGETEVIASER